MASYCKVWGHSAVVYAKTAETIDMPFGLRTRVDPGNHVLDWGPDACGKGQFWWKKTHCNL